MRNHFDVLEDVIVDDDGVGEHEDGFRDAQCVFQGCVACDGFEILDTVIRHVANGAACEGGDFRQLDILVPFQFFLKEKKRISRVLPSGACANEAERICGARLASARR